MYKAFLMMIELQAGYHHLSLLDACQAWMAKQSRAYLLSTRDSLQATIELINSHLADRITDV
jgi:hypothetical protein